MGGNDFLLGAASWNARAWLGHAGIEEGAPADIVVFAEDPRVTISVVREPVLIILNDAWWADPRRTEPGHGLP